MMNSGVKNSFRIRGGQKLNGKIEVRGSKNAATKLVAASLLTSEPCEIYNLPRIKDVEVMLDILRDMGSEISIGNHTVRIDNSGADISKLPTKKVSELRSSVVLAGPLLARFGYVEMPYPGGDMIGDRDLDTHFNAFSDMGCYVEANKEKFVIKKPPVPLKKYKVVLDEFSVTATENILMYASSLLAKTEISVAAEEPHIENLIAFLRSGGADIFGPISHKIMVEGKKRLGGMHAKVVPDYIEAGTFVILGALAGGKISIHNFPHEDLELFVHRLKRAGVAIKKTGKQSVEVEGSDKIYLPKIQTMLHPGVPTDLQSPIGVLATQSEGETLLHDTLYSRRLEYIRELKKMGANVKILDPHRAMIYGPTPLVGASIEGKDIRGGMSLIIAALIASGETILGNTYQVDRGYEKIEERLSAIGADIKRI